MIFLIFRTLHSLAFRRLGIKKEDVMQRRHYVDFGKRVKEDIGYAKYEDDHNGFFTTDSEYLRLINLAKLRNIAPEKLYDAGEHNGDLERDKVITIAKELEKYKEQITPGQVGEAWCFTLNKKFFDIYILLVIHIP